MVLLDDLHWADTTSLLLLDFLAQELSTSRLFVAGAYRDVDLRRGDPLLLTLGNQIRNVFSDVVCSIGQCPAPPPPPD